MQFSIFAALYKQFFEARLENTYLASLNHLPIYYQHPDVTLEFGTCTVYYYLAFNTLY